MYTDEINRLIAIHVMKVEPKLEYANDRNKAATVIEKILFSGDDKLIERFNTEAEKSYGKEFTKMNTIQRIFYHAPVDICKAA